MTARGQKPRPVAPRGLNFRLALFLSGLFALLPLVALGDAPGALRKIPAGGCYCGCSKRRQMGDCIKLCQLPKYASRWWATSCVKPRIHKPAGNPDAGPRFPHPGRAERAGN
jgi:hypothetical protein